MSTTATDPNWISSTSTPTTKKNWDKTLSVESHITSVQAPHGQQKILSPRIAVTTQIKLVPRISMQYNTVTYFLYKGSKDTIRKKLISLSVKIFTYIHAKLHCIFRNNDFTLISKYKKMSKNIQTYTVFTPNSDLIDFTLSNARQFYSSRGDPLGRPLGSERVKKQSP